MLCPCSISFYHFIAFIIVSRWEGLSLLAMVHVDVHKLTLIAPLTVDDFSWGTTRQVAQSRSLTRQKGVRNLDIDKSDTEMRGYGNGTIDFSDDELKLDDELKQISLVYLKLLPQRKTTVQRHQQYHQCPVT